MNKIITFIIILLFLSACNSTKDAFTLKKKSSADEFLVEKKSPLVLPPDYSKLPLPDDKIKDENETKDEDIKLIIGSNNENSSKNTKKNSIPASLEESILRQIK
jgi:hypothetical protein